MENTHHQNSFLGGAVENNMATALHPTQPRAYVITSQAELWQYGKPLATRLQTVEVLDRLIGAPSPQGVFRDLIQVAPGEDGIVKASHRLRRFPCELDCLANALKGITFKSAAGISRINRGSQRR